MLKRLTFEEKKSRRISASILGGLMLANSLFCMPNTYSVHFSPDNNTVKTSSSGNKSLFTGFASGFTLGGLGAGLVCGLYNLYHRPSIIENIIKNMNKDNCIVLSEIMYNKIIDKVNLDSINEKKLKSETEILNSWNKKLDEIFKFGKYHHSETFNNAVDNFIDIVKKILDSNGIELANFVNGKDKKIVLKLLFSFAKTIPETLNIEEKLINKSDEHEHSSDDDLLRDSNIDKELLEYCSEIDYSSDNYMAKPSEEYRNDVCICRCYDTYYIWIPREECWRHIPFDYYDKMLTDEEELRNKPQITQNSVFYDKRDFTFWDGTQWLCVKHFIGAREPSRTNRPKYMTEYAVFEELNSGFDTEMLNNCLEVNGFGKDISIPEPDEEYKNDLCLCANGGCEYMWIPSEQCWRYAPLYSFNRLLTNEEELINKPPITQDGIFYDRRDLSCWDGTQWSCVKHFIGARKPSRTNRPKYMTVYEVKRELHPDIDILLLDNYTELTDPKSSDSSFIPEPTEEYRNDLCICRYNNGYYIWIPSEQYWKKISFNYYTKLLTDEEKLRTRPELVQNRVFYSKYDFTFWDGTQWLCVKHFIGAKEPSRIDRPTYMTENDVRKELEQN